jgi:hypothetical protein
MSKQNKPISWIKIGLTCLILWFLLKACGEISGIDDRFYSTEGKEAIQKVNELSETTIIPIDTIKNAHYAHYAKGGMPADPNFHYRFDIDRQVLDSFIKKQKLKADIKGGNCLPESSSQRGVGDWWQPSEVQLKACFRWNAKNTDYYMAFKDLDSKTVQVYIFGYNN